MKQGIDNSICLALVVINLKVITKKFLSPADLSEAQTFCLYKSSVVIIVGKHKNFMLRAL